jgi:hypothetical protein
MKGLLFLGCKYSFPEKTRFGGGAIVKNSPVVHTVIEHVIPCDNRAEGTL